VIFIPVMPEAPTCTDPTAFGMLARHLRSAAVASGRLHYLSNAGREARLGSLTTFLLESFPIACSTGMTQACKGLILRRIENEGDSRSAQSQSLSAPKKLCTHE
jgi:hypothetical protein